MSDFFDKAMSQKRKANSFSANSTTQSSSNTFFDKAMNQGASYKWTEDRKRDFIDANTPMYELNGKDGTSFRCRLSNVEGNGCARQSFGEGVY